MNIGISTDDFDLDYPAESSDRMTIESTGVTDFLSIFKSGIGLDISKNHTGVCLWRDGKVECIGFAVEMDYDKGSYLAEARMRLEFKSKLKELLEGFEWEVCIIEDVYGGANFDTTRKLLALNCVLDELVLEGSVSVGNIYRFKEAEWLKGLREINSEVGKRLNPKMECQKILESIGFDFYMQHKDDSESAKKAIFFEDICDAAGQLLGLSMRLRRAEANIKSSSVKLSSLFIDFVETEEDIHWSDNKVIASAPQQWNTIEKPIDFEQRILDDVKNDDSCVYILCVSTALLGTFGIRMGFDFYDQGYGYLVYYSKSLNKQYK